MRVNPVNRHYLMAAIGIEATNVFLLLDGLENISLVKHRNSWKVVFKEGQVKLRKQKPNDLVKSQVSALKVVCRTAPQKISVRIKQIDTLFCTGRIRDSSVNLSS